MKNKMLANLRKITRYILVLSAVILSFPSISAAQPVGTPTVTIKSQTASNGTTINVPVNASNFANTVAGMDFSIQYDPALLTYTGITQNAISGHGSLLVNDVSNTIKINWFDSAALNINSGTLLTVNFTVVSASTTNASLDFIGTKEISNSSGDIVTSSFVNGVIFLNTVATFGNNYTIAENANGLDASIDSLGNLYSVYESSGNIYIRKNRGGAELIGTGSGPAIAIDSSDNIHVIYANSGLKYKKKTGAVWGDERAVAGGAVFYSIDTDSTGSAHIAYDDGGPGGRGHIVYIKDNGGTWSDPIWEATGWYDSGSGNYYHQPVIRIDDGDKYHLAYEADNWGGRASWSERSINITSNSIYGDKGIGGFEWNAGVGLTRNSLALNGAEAYLAYTNGGTQNVALVNDSWTVLTSFAGSAGSANYKSGKVGVAYVNGSVQYIENAGFGFTSPADLGTGSGPVTLLGSRHVFFLDGTSIKLASNQAIAAPFSSAKTIASFIFEGLDPVISGVINESDHTIALTVPFSTNVSALIPTIVISADASIDPDTGVAQDFISPVTYTVTAEDGSTKNYIVTVTVSANPDIAAAQAVIDQISALPTPANLVLGDATAVANATAAYTALTETQKGLVLNLAVLTAAEAQMAALTTATTKVTELETAAAEDLTIEVNLTAAEAAVTAAYTSFGSVVAGGAKTALAAKFNTASGIVSSATLAFDKAALVDSLIQGTNPDLSHITTALANPLPAHGSHGSGITWTSSNPAIVSNDGQTINRPAYADGDMAVTLTATIGRGIAVIYNLNSVGGSGGGGGAGMGSTKIFTLTVLKLPANTVATITSAIYTVSMGGTASETVANVPFGTSKSDFLSALAKGEVNQTWNVAGISDPVTTGDTLVVTAEDGTTTVTYVVTVNLQPDTASPVVDSFFIPETSDSLTVSISSFVAHDNVGVTGYILTETFEIPSASNPNWSVVVPSDYTFSTDGVKTLYAWAKDTADNISLSLNDSVTIILPDTVAPIITAPVDIGQEANGIISTVSLGTATAVDAVDPNPIITNDAPAGFPLGTTIVTWTATDASGNHASVAQKVVVADTILPVVNLNTPASPTKNPSISFTIIDKTLMTTDCKVNDGDFSSCASPFEPVLDSGDYTVTVRAADAAGNIGSGTTDSFTVDVNAPAINITGPAAVSKNTDLSFTFDSPEVGVSFECKLGSSEFASCVSPVLYEGVSEGSHEFTVRATDVVGNIGTKSYNFIVDLTPPVITLHDDILSIAANASGTVVTYTVPNSTDAVDGIFSAICSPASGSTFALGITSVSCNASDVAGNAAAPTTFNITVEDKNPPIITLIGSSTTSLAVDQTYTELGATAADNVDGDVTSHIVITGSVDIETAGTYYINYNVSDAAGNSAEQKTRTVIVSALQITGEQKINISTNSATVKWTTSHPATSRVLFDTVSHPNPITATTTNYGYANSTVEDVAMVTDHSVIVSGLLAGKTYYMRPVSHGSPEIFGDEIMITTTAQSSGSTGGGGGASANNNPPTPPTGGYVLKINNGAVSTATTSVILTLNGGTQAVKMVIANGEDFSTVSQEVYATTKAWTLTAGNGTKKVCVKFYGSNGYPSASVCAQIVLGTAKIGDTNGDNKVDKYDFSLMMANWGKTGSNSCDLNNDGKVNKYDFALLMSKWGL
jgi:hypothetical protein